MRAPELYCSCEFLRERLMRIEAPHVCRVSSTRLTYFNGTCRPVPPTTQSGFDCMVLDKVRVTSNNRMGDRGSDH